eukprot:6121028-Amphidinium_carterae.1
MRSHSLIRAALASAALGNRKESIRFQLCLAWPVLHAVPASGFFAPTKWFLGRVTENFPKHSKLAGRRY